MAEGRYEEALVILKQGAKANRRTLPPDAELREMMERFKSQVRSFYLHWTYLPQRSRIKFFQRTLILFIGQTHYFCPFLNTMAKCSINGISVDGRPGRRMVGAAVPQKTIILYSKSTITALKTEKHVAIVGTWRFANNLRVKWRIHKIHESAKSVECNSLNVLLVLCFVY